MADTHAISPLAHRAGLDAPNGAASIVERPHLGKLILRCRAEVTARAVKTASGTELPTTANKSSRSETTLILWLGPDEWMFVTDPGVEKALHSELAAALSNTHHQLVDVSDAYTVIELAGTRTREMLMKLTTLDMHPKEFMPGDTAGSMFGRVSATLHLENGETPRFQLIAQRSMADYLWCLLAEAGREFGLPEQRPEAGETMRP